MAHRTFKLTKEDGQEVLHKLATLAETEDLMDEYGITERDVQEMMLRVPAEHGGEWTIDSPMVECVCAEMQDHVIVLRDIAHDARNGGAPGEALRISKQAKRLEETFAD